MTKRKAPVTAPVSLRTRYIRDERDNNRVLTVVTRLTQTGGTKKKPKHRIDYGISVNSPPRLVRLSNDQVKKLGLEGLNLVVHRQMPGDKFSRVRGRTIANGQLNCERTVRSFDINLATQNPYEEVLRNIAALKSENHQAARIAEDAFLQFQIRAATLNTVLQFNEAPPVKKARKVAVKKDSSNVINALNLLEEVLPSSPFPTILVSTTPETQVREPA